MSTKWSVVLMTMMMVIGSLGALGLAAGGPSGRTADNDNDFASANALTSGVANTGDVNGTDDGSDFYKIDLKAGECMKVVLSYTDDTLPIYFSVWDPGQNDVLDITSGNTTRGDTYFATENGTHYVEVWTFFDEQSYTLTVTVSFPTTLVPGVQVKSMLEIDGVARTEYYRIWLDGNVSGKTEGVYVNMTEDLSTTDFNLFMWGITGISLNPYNLSRMVSPHETVSCAASETGWYYCLVNTWDGSAGYTLDITSFQAPSDGNNDIANATKVKHNAIASGTLDQGWDKFDWYRYHVFPSDTFQARASRAAGTDLFYLSIFSPSLELLDEDWNVQAGAIVNSITLNLPAAPSDTNYYVAVWSYAAIRNNQYSDETAKETYTLTFTSTNHFPQVVSSFDDIVMDEDTTMLVPAGTHFTDMDEDALTFSTTGGTSVVVTYNATSGNLEVTPAANWNGAETIMITADDGYNGRTSLTMNVTVKSVNDSPFVKKKMADLKMLQGGTDTSLDLSKVFYDNDLTYGDALNYTVESTGRLGVTIAADGKVTIVDPIDFYGLVSMQFTATDGEGASAVAPCNVTVQHVNQPPRVKTQPGNISVDEDSTATLDLSGTFTDLDNDPITILASGQTRITVIIDPNTNIVTFKPSPNLSGFYEDIKFTAQDDKGYGEYFVVVRVTVVVVNDPPVIKAASPTGEVTLTETEGLEFSVTVTTVETWDTFNYTWYLDDKDLLWNENAYPLSTDYNSAGKHVLKVVVDDGTDSVSRQWNITVVNKNRDPTDVKIGSPRTGETFMQATEIEFSGSAKDADGDELTYSWLDGRNELSTEKDFTTTTLKPGSHSIVLEVSDGTGTVKSKQITITVNPNTAPRIITLTPASGEDFSTGKRIDFSVSARDTEDDPLTYQWSEAGRVLSTQPSFSSSDLKEGTHNIQLSIYDGFSYTNQTVVVEVVAPAAAQGLSNRNLYILAGVIAIVVIAAVVAVMMMRRKKPAAPAPEAQAAPPVAPGPVVDPYATPQQDYQVPPATPYYDTGGYQPPAGEPAQPEAGAYQAPAEQPYDPSQYSAESGVSNEQPGVSGSQPAWASAPARPPMPSEQPPAEAQPVEPPTEGKQ